MRFHAFDTDEGVAHELRRRILARSGSVRVAMAAKMFATAKMLVTSRARELGVSGDVDLRLTVLVQLYGDDLTAEQYAAIRARYAARLQRR